MGLDRGSVVDLAEIRDAIDRALAEGRGETLRPVLDSGMIVKVIRDDGAALSEAVLDAEWEAERARRAADMAWARSIVNLRIDGVPVDLIEVVMGPPSSMTT